MHKLAKIITSDRSPKLACNEYNAYNALLIA